MGLRTLSPLLLGLLLLSVCYRAAGLEPEDVLFIKAGPLTIRPQVALTETYNDNIFYQAKDPLQDFITTISPGLRLQLGRPEHNFIALGYTYDQLLYAENSDLNTRSEE